MCGGHGGTAQAPPSRAGPTPLYSGTNTISGPSLERTGGGHGGTAQAPPTRAGLTPLYSGTATISGPSHERTGGEHGGIAGAAGACRADTTFSDYRRAAVRAQSARIIMTMGRAGPTIMATALGALSPGAMHLILNMGPAPIRAQRANPLRGVPASFVRGVPASFVRGVPLSRCPRVLPRDTAPRALESLPPALSPALSLSLSLSSFSLSSHPPFLAPLAASAPSRRILPGQAACTAGLPSATQPTRRVRRRRRRRRSRHCFRRRPVAVPAARAAVAAAPPLFPPPLPLILR